MATDDQQVLVTGTASAPTHFTIPGNGQIQPKAIFAHFNGASAASPFVPTLKVISDGGETVAICPCPTIVAAAGSADVSWFPHVAVVEGVAPGAGVTLEQLLLDSTSTGVTSATVLASGVSYTITVQGTYSFWNSALTFGTPNADAMFPGAAGGRVSTQVGVDPECVFAQPNSATPPNIGHTVAFQIDLGSGFSHVEPDGGPFATPQANYLYHYSVTGQGSAASFKIADAPLADNYGKLQITIQGTSGGSSGGGGSGSLLPPTSVSNSLLRAVSGVPTWQAQPSITESDLSLSNVTTDDVSTTKHGFAPKAPNDASKFLDGTGAYSVPPGGAGTISDITSTGSTITVSSPTGPTTNVDLPASGVSAGTYGSAADVAQVTVDAEGRVTAAANVAIGGGVVVSADGWVDDTAETWTYASFAAGPPAVGTFTVPGDMRAKYSVGTRIKLTQTTGKYFVVVADSTYDGTKTTVSVSGGTDYTLANAAISANYHSYVINPQGYPGDFTVDLGQTGWSGSPSVVANFHLTGRLCSLEISNIDGTSSSASSAAVLPVTAGQTMSSPIQATNNGTLASTPGLALASGTTTTLNFFLNYAGAGWTSSGTKRVRYCNFTYPV